jgi:hypothetical protein
MKIAFDIDDTLIIPSVVTGNRDIPNFDTIAIYRWFQAQGYEMVLWSGSGCDWAQTWGEKLGLEPFEVRVKSADYDDILIAFDDCDVLLGIANVKVKRLDNFVSRKEWNKNKKSSLDLDLLAKEIELYGKQEPRETKQPNQISNRQATT